MPPGFVGPPWLPWDSSSRTDRRHLFCFPHRGISRESMKERSVGSQDLNKESLDICGLSKMIPRGEKLQIFNGSI